MIRKMAKSKMKVNGKKISLPVSEYSGDINNPELFGYLYDPQNENYFIENWKEKTFYDKISKSEILQDWGFEISKYFDFEMQKLTPEQAANNNFLLLNNIFKNLDGVEIDHYDITRFFYNYFDLEKVDCYDVEFAFDNCTFFNKSDFENLNDEQFEHFVKLEIKKAIIELEDYCDKQFEEEEEYFYFEDYKNYFEEEEEEEEEEEAN